MATPLDTGSALTRLTSMVDVKECYDVPAPELLPLQLEAANELFQDRLGRIRLLQNRADEAGITEVKTREDLVPLLFAHTAYKSYPEGWLVEQKWDRLGGGSARSHQIRWKMLIYRMFPISTIGSAGWNESGIFCAVPVVPPVSRQ